MPLSADVPHEQAAEARTPRSLACGPARSRHRLIAIVDMYEQAPGVILRMPVNIFAHRTERCP